MTVKPAISASECSLLSLFSMVEGFCFPVDLREFVA